MLFTMLLIQKHSIISEKLLFEFIRIIVRIYLNFFTVFEFLCLFEPFWTSYHVKNWQLFKAFFRCVAAFSRLFLINQLCIRAGDEKKKTPICCRYFWRMAVFTVRRRRLRRRRKRMGLASATKCKGGGGEGGEGWITDFFSWLVLSFLPFLPFFFMGRRQRRQRNSEVPSVKVIAAIFGLSWGASSGFLSAAFAYSTKLVCLWNRYFWYPAPPRLQKRCISREGRSRKCQ